LYGIDEFQNKVVSKCWLMNYLRLKQFIHQKRQDIFVLKFILYGIDEFQNKAVSKCWLMNYLRLQAGDSTKNHYYCNRAPNRP
jgi:hypothetical protein